MLVQNQVKKISQMKNDLEKYQQLLKATNAKLIKAEETTARLTSPSVPKLGLNTVLSIREDKKGDGK